MFKIEKIPCYHKIRHLNTFLILVFSILIEKQCATKCVVCYLFTFNVATRYHMCHLPSIYQTLLKYEARVFWIASVLKLEFWNELSRSLEHNTGTKQQNSDWGHQGKANEFGRIAGKWSFEIFSGMCIRAAVTESPGLCLWVERELLRAWASSYVPVWFFKNNYI